MKRELANGDIIDMTSGEIISLNAESHDESSILPVTVTKLQLMHKLKEIGIWTAFWDYVKANEDVWLEFMLARDIETDNPLVLQIGEQFGYTNGEFIGLMRGAKDL